MLIFNCVKHYVCYNSTCVNSTCVDIALHFLLCDTDSGDSSSDSGDETKIQASGKPFSVPKTLSSRLQAESESSYDCYTRKPHKQPTVMKKTSQSATAFDSVEVDPLKSSALRLFCSECYYAQLANPRRVGTCKSTNHRKVCKRMLDKLFLIVSNYFFFYP